MAEQNRLDSESLVRPERTPQDSGFSLRAIDSSERMARSLSPWVREMLDSGSAPADGGSLVHRLMRRRANESVSFLSTLAILKRFHRIATRTSSWTADVGTVSPNLFEKFSEEMFKNWDMGANNITALLKINRQEEAIDMPLAGEQGSGQPKQSQPAANQMPAMTMEDIRRRVEEARKFQSLSPAAVPDFVKAQDSSGPPEVRPTAQHPGRGPSPSSPRPTDQPMARPLPERGQPTPPSGQPSPQQPSQAGNEQTSEQPARPSPRMMRRRMARKVEYLSMPGGEDGDDGETQNADDSDAGPPGHFDTGPPPLDWLFPPSETHWFAFRGQETVQRATARRSIGPRRSIVPVRIARTAPGKRPVRSTSTRHAPSRVSVLQRAMDRLTASTSGRLLASRPHVLLDHLQRQSAAPALVRQSESPAQAPASGLATLDTVADTISFGPQSSSLSPLQRSQRSESALLPVSLEDFALPYLQRLRQHAAASQTGQTQIGPDLAERPEFRVGRATLQPSRSEQASRAVALRLERRPVARSQALSALQSRPLRTPPTVMRLTQAPEVDEGRRDMGQISPGSDSFSTSARGGMDLQTGGQGLVQESAAAQQPGETATGPAFLQPMESQQPGELQHSFEPVSGLWRSPMLRRQPLGRQSLKTATLAEEMGRPVSIEALGTQSIPARAARAVLPSMELTLARFRRNANTPVQPVAAGVARGLHQAASSPLRESSLGERVLRRDFAGTRADLLADGLLALPETRMIYKPTGGRSSGLAHALAPSLRGQTRQLLQRATTTDEWNSREPVPDLQRARGLRPQLRSTQRSERPLSSRGRTPLEPVSRLWRTPMLSPDGQLSMPPPLQGRSADLFGTVQQGTQDSILMADRSLDHSPLPLASFRIAKSRFGTLADSAQEPTNVSASVPTTLRPADRSAQAYVRVDRLAVGRSQRAADRRDHLLEHAMSPPIGRSEPTLLERVVRRRVLPTAKPAEQSRSVSVVSNLGPADEPSISGYLQRSYRPGETGQAAALLSRQRQQAAAVAPVSAAWVAASSFGEIAQQLPGVTDSFVQTFPAIPLPTSPATSASAAMPSELRRTDLPLRRSSSPMSSVQSAFSQLSTEGSRPARPLSDQVLSRDFAHTRRGLLQRVPVGDQNTLPRTDSRSDETARGRGAQMTVTLLDLTRQPAYQVGLPRSRSMPTTNLQDAGPVGSATSQLQWLNLRLGSSRTEGEIGRASVRLPETAQQSDLVLRQRVDASSPSSSSQPSDDPRAQGSIEQPGELNIQRKMLHPGAVARAADQEKTRQQRRRRLEPVSSLWRTELLHDHAASFSASGRDVAGPVALSGDDLLGTTDLQRTIGLQNSGTDSSTADQGPSSGNAVFAPLELSLNRLLGRSPRRGTPRGEGTIEESAPGTLGVSSPSPQPSARIGPRQNVARVVDQLEAGGWRFKRSRRQPPAPTQAVQRTLDHLSGGESRPIPAQPRTLLERVLQRDFAGVRVKMAALGPLGIEAAARGNTVYLDRGQARLDSRDSLALLGHELTHIAASGAAPRLGTPTVQRAQDSADLPLARPLMPSLTQRLSRQFVQMSLAAEEATAEQVENALRRGARSASDSREPASIEQGSRSAALLAQRRLATSRFAPVSQSWPVQDSLPVAESASATVDLLETQGWRFKREQRGSSADSSSVQRATAELTARPNGALPLPVRPRTLMERVLQRDFSGVRLQAAGLAPLGVEAAAHGQTVYMQRSALAQLERPDNLALLGHELTHVAAGANPPIRRSASFETNGATMGNGVNSAPLPLSLPPRAQLQRSVQHEENAAAQVEQGIQRLLRQSATVQRDPLEPPSTNGSDKAQPSASPIARRRATQGPTMGAVRITGSGAKVQRDEDEGSVLAGVSSESMPVVQRTPARASATSAAPPAAAQTEPDMLIARATQSAPVEHIQREDNGNLDESFVDYDQSAEAEPDWDRLADRIYPLIVRMLRLDRERRPI